MGSSAAGKNGRADVLQAKLALQAKLEALFRIQNERGRNSRTKVEATLRRVTVAIKQVGQRRGTSAQRIGAHRRPPLQEPPALQCPSCGRVGAKLLL